MTRVAVIGNAGGGKSTMCRKLGQALDLAVYPVDQIQWKPGWVRTAAAEFKQRHEDWLARERWIIDGWGSWEAIEARFAAADTIIFVDHPLFIHYWWAFKRQFQCLFWPRPNGPEGNLAPHGLHIPAVTLTDSHPLLDKSLSREIIAESGFFQ